MNSFGLIGDPIATSLSPALFNAGYEGKYNYDLIEGADFGASFKAFEDRYKGINVTAPFKEQLLHVRTSTPPTAGKSAPPTSW